MKNNKEYTYLAVDLGTSNIIVYVSGHGIVYNEPSIMAYNTLTNESIALGAEAYDLVGKTHSEIRLVKPISEGVITDMDAANDLLKQIFGRLKMIDVWKNSVVLIACPSGITELERDALKQIAKSLGASFVFTEDSVLLSAIGAGVNVTLPQGNLVIDIGAGTTEMAIVSSNLVIASRSEKVAGDHFNEEIAKYVRAEYNVLLGEKTTETVKKEIGTLIKLTNDRELKVYGRDVVTGLPREVILRANEIKNVLLTPFSKITDAVVELLEQTPPELSGDIIRNGITLSGGGSLIKGVVKYFESIFQLKVTAAQDPTLCVIEGARSYESNLSKFVERAQLLEKRMTPFTKLR
ncbi:rod shape-determining protein [Spiroplasma endosymbiont of Anurida maritima]|uniref:rod shape-determining protein n=1 Tax=Spiroplasma endosymbiont of Anurida maritima TaxID=2967972 RepID=UPI0036D2FC9F